MAQKSKYAPEEKLRIVKLRLDEGVSLRQLSKHEGIAATVIVNWTRLYQMGGTAALTPVEIKRKYSAELKLKAVTDYLTSDLSMDAICNKYNISYSVVLRKWIKRYNDHGTFKNCGGESNMNKARKTTLDERIQIVGDCLATGTDYNDIAVKYNVTYRQIYGWLKKYRELGVAGLEDRRGQRTASQTPRTQEEKLRIKIAQLEQEKHLLEVENALLKKLEELERGNRFLK